MSQYKRCYIAGGNYFFTLVTHKRRPIFLDPQNVKFLKDAIAKVKQTYPFSLNAYVILPDHLHCLLKLPDNDADYSIRWRLIETHFSKRVVGSSNHRNEKDIWQRRFWERSIRNEEEWIKYLDYIHIIP